MHNVALRPVFEIISQADLAKALKVRTQAITRWKKGKVPAIRVLGIEAATGGRVTRHQLRPDLYPIESAT